MFPADWENRMRNFIFKLYTDIPSAARFEILSMMKHKDLDVLSLTLEYPVRGNKREKATQLNEYFEQPAIWKKISK